MFPVGQRTYRKAQKHKEAKGSIHCYLSVGGTVRNYHTWARTVMYALLKGLPVSLREMRHLRVGFLE